MISEFFKDFIKQCFSGELSTCELRLSQKEKEYVSSEYQHARFKEIPNAENSEDKIWYEVTID